MTTEERLSHIEENQRVNGQKLDAILVTLHGNGSLGVTQKVTIMWRIHAWLLCSLSALAGSVLTYGITHLIRP